MSDETARGGALDLRVATCLTLPERDPDAAPLAAALVAAGVRAEVVAWDDDAVDWDAPVPTLLRSTWNYALHLDRFLAWCERVERASVLINDAAIAREFTHKRYLLALAARGVPTVPTVLLPADEARRADPTAVARALAALGALAAAAPAQVIIKPAVGAGSLGVRRLPAGEPAEIAAHLATLGGDALVQPYLESVEGHGERSLIWIDGELTHAVRKARRLLGDPESVTGPFPIADDERAVALAALAPYRGRALYGRVDLARDPAGRPCVMELELVEPSLFFARHPPALDRFVAGLRRRLD